MNGPILEKKFSIFCQNSEGFDITAVPLRLTQWMVVMELYNPEVVLQLSEVLHDFKISLHQRVVYSGKAVVRNLIQVGAALICEATLAEAWWDIDQFEASQPPQALAKKFDHFVQQWQTVYKVLPQFKVAVADLQAFLLDLRIWLDQLQIALGAPGSPQQVERERDAAAQLTGATTAALNALFERFEHVASTIEPGLEGCHAVFSQRQLHPLLLSSPFMYRIFRKPLGHAGDYEMVNMILRDPYQGSSLFGKLLNAYILSQKPAVAHRNRVQYLTEKIGEETRRLLASGKSIRILNIGCGPAQEIQMFLERDPVSNRADITLLDFDEETLDFASRAILEFKERHHRSTSLKFVKQSVFAMLKETRKSQWVPLEYDLIYCAGLFDYLGDSVCRELMGIFYKLLAPSGLFVGTNVDAGIPIRNIMEYLFEWHLIYRDAEGFVALAPAEAGPGGVALKADPTANNLYLEVRRTSGQR